MENSTLKDRRKKYFTVGDEVYKREKDGSEKQILHSTKSTVRNTAVALLNDEYYKSLKRRIETFEVVGKKIQETLNYSYQILKPVIADGGELGENAYKIIVMLSNIGKGLESAKQILCEKVVD